MARPHWSEPERQHVGGTDSNQEPGYAGFQRAARDRFVREDADVKPSFAADVLLRSDTPRLDGLSLDPPALSGLQSEIAEDDAVAPLGLTFYTSSLAFSVLHSLGHQRHRTVLPRTYLD